MARILIAAPTHEKHAEFLDGFIAHARSQTIPCDILLADTSEDLEFAEGLARRGVRTCTVQGQNKYERVINGRRAIIAEFLNGTWTHLFFVDCDVFIPNDAAQRLVAHDLPIVSGVYLTPLLLQGRRYILPVAYDLTHSTDLRKPIPVAEVLDPSMRKVHSVGFGCCMIRRDVLGRVTLRDHTGGTATEDIIFCIDARTAGYDIWLDTGVWTEHHVGTLDSPVNRLLTKEWNLQQ